MWYSVCELLHVTFDVTVKKSSAQNEQRSQCSVQLVLVPAPGGLKLTVWMSSAHSRSGQVQCSGSVKARRRDRSTTSAFSRCDRGDLDPLWHHEHRLHRYRTVDIGSAGKQSTYRCLQLRRGHVHNHDCGRGSVCVAVSTEWISHVSYILYV